MIWSHINFHISKFFIDNKCFYHKKFLSMLSNPPLNPCLIAPPILETNPLLDFNDDKPNWYECHINFHISRYSYRNRKRNWYGHWYEVHINFTNWYEVHINIHINLSCDPYRSIYWYGYWYDFHINLLNWYENHINVHINLNCDPYRSIYWYEHWYEVHINVIYDC